MDTLFVGREILKFEVLESTNAYLKDLYRKSSVSEGLTVLADKQTSGRGQFGKCWESESGKNLLFSIFLRPSFLSASQHFLINMSVCLALYDSLNELVPGFLIKWPNDILFNKQKIAGVLIENSINGSKLENSVVGIGLNVNQTDFGDSTDRTSLMKLMGNEISRDFVLEKVMKNLEARYLRIKAGEQGSLFRDYHQSLYGREGEIEVFINDELKPATINGVEADGRLSILIDGKRRRFSFNEIKFKLT